MVERSARAPMTELLRREVSVAARELEELGEHELAAEGYALVEDRESQARALAQAGSVDRLDALLDEQQSQERNDRTRREAQDTFTSLVASGQRRDAVLVARASGDDLLRERARALEARRPASNAVRLQLAGRSFAVVLGDEVVIGRAPEGSGEPTGAIAVASVALSRKHVALLRRGQEVFVRDLGSRNGTFLRGLRLAGEVSIGYGLDLDLGGEVPLSVRRTDDLPGAVAVVVGGMRHVAPLGAAQLGMGKWRLERGPDSWVELVTDDDPPAHAGSIRLVPRVSLLVGDAIASERGGAPHVVVEA